MKCINCGQELSNDIKFCSNCGTPVGEVQQTPIQYNAEQSIENPSVQKANRIGKISMWATIAAIVMCFVITGFGFSFWWYLFIIFMAFMAFIQFITVYSGSMSDGDIFIAKAASIICFVCIGLLWQCGPLNSNYASEREAAQSSESASTLSWILGKWEMRLDSGGKMIVTINGDGSSRLEVKRGYVTVLDYTGTFYISGDYLYLSFDGMGSNPQLIMDKEQKKLYSAEGNAYSKSY